MTITVSYLKVNRYFWHSAWLFAALACMIVSGCVKDNEDPGWTLGKGDRLPDFSVLMNDGSRVSSGSLRGTPSVIVFFNTECADCRRELPVIQKEYDQSLTAGNGVRYVCISREEGTESVMQYWEDNGLTMPFSAQMGREVYDLFASSGIPRIYRVDSELMIVGVE